MFDLESIFKHCICVCPSFRLDVLSSIFKRFPDTRKIKPYQMPLLAQMFCDGDYVQYDRAFLHYNVNQDKALKVKQELKSDLILKLHEKWAEEYDNFLNDFSLYFSDAEIVNLLYHKVRYEHIGNRSQNINTYLVETTEEYIRKMREKGCRNSIRRIIERIEQLHLFNNLLSPEEQKKFFEFLTHFEEES